MVGVAEDERVVGDAQPRVAARGERRAADDHVDRAQLHALVDVGLLAERAGREDLDVVLAVGALLDLLGGPHRFGVVRLGGLVDMRPLQLGLRGRRRGGSASGSSGQQGSSQTVSSVSPPLCRSGSRGANRPQSAPVDLRAAACRAPARALRPPASAEVRADTTAAHRHGARGSAGTARSNTLANGRRRVVELARHHAVGRQRHALGRQRADLHDAPAAAHGVRQVASAAARPETSSATSGSPTSRQPASAAIRSVRTVRSAPTWRAICQRLVDDVGDRDCGGAGQPGGQHHHAADGAAAGDQHALAEQRRRRAAPRAGRPTAARRRRSRPARGRRATGRHWRSGITKASRNMPCTCGKTLALPRKRILRHRFSRPPRQ